MPCKRIKCTFYNKTYLTHCEKCQVESALYTCDSGYIPIKVEQGYYGTLPKMPAVSKNNVKIK